MTSASDLASAVVPVRETGAHRLTAAGVVARLGEIIILFGGIPALVWLDVIPLWAFWGLLGAGAAYVCLVLSLDRTFRWSSAWHWPRSRAEIRRVILLWMVAVPLMVLFTWGVDRGLIPLDTKQPHDLLFSFPRGAPAFWAAVMCLYPIFSVAPQELIFRVFFFHRFEPLFGSRGITIIASALAFGWGHILFQNWIAVALSTVLGLLLGITYSRTRSAPAAWLEHALYGDAAFTIGLGWFFFTGAVGR